MAASSLTIPELAGVVLFRRVRALGGVDQWRLVGTALVAFLLIDYLRLTLTSPSPLPNAALATVMDVVAYVSIGVALWRPRLGLLLTALPLLAALFWSSTSLDALLLALVPALVIGQLRGRPAALASGLVAAYVALRVAAYQGDQRAPLAAILSGHAVVGIAVGWLLHVGRARRERAEQSAFEVALADAKIRADERRALSRELHDVVTHQLSTASLQIMGARQAADAAVLSRALGTIDRTTAEALTELRLLAHVLRDDPATAAAGTEIRELSERVPPTQAAAAAERALIGAGFEAVIEVPAAADDVELTVQQTVARVITEATANVIQHGVPRGRCTIQVTVGRQEVTVKATNPTAGGGRPVLGWGLKSLRERVSLTGGSLSAGRPGGDWVLSVTVPRG